MYIHVHGSRFVYLPVPVNKMLSYLIVVSIPFNTMYFKVHGRKIVVPVPGIMMLDVGIDRWSVCRIMMLRLEL